MENGNFNEIIDFAVELEKASVAFYQELQRVNLIIDKQNLIMGFIEAEKIHIDILENLRKNFRRNSITLQVKDIDTTGSVADISNLKEMSYDEIIGTAIKLEEESCNLYLRMAENSRDPAAKKLLNRLALEEEKHKLLIEDLKFNRN